MGIYLFSWEKSSEGRGCWKNGYGTMRSGEDAGDEKKIE